LGDIGDVVWSLPAIQAIRDSYPEASVSVLLREGIGSLAERKRAEAITDACPGRVFNMAGKTTLGELAGLP
jgi:ADP-heptose:LPS heptosyltransferase